METKNTKSRGFTLVELLVVTTVFVLIIVTAVDLFVLMVRHQRRILAEQELLNQTSYALEYMSRALRMATKDETGLCLSLPETNYEILDAGKTIIFVNHTSNDKCQEFSWDSENKKIVEVIRNAGGGVIATLPLTSDNLEVNYFNIMVYGDGADMLQPRVVMSMEIQSKGVGNQPKKQIQTTISQRNLDE